jgi:hypothetical protein
MAAAARESGERLAEFRRPADWLRRSPLSRFIWDELLARAPLSNKQITTKLASSGFQCPYGETWARSVNAPAFKQFIRRIRKQMRKPGRIPGKTLPQ